jgi:hypothetical protein
MHREEAWDEFLIDKEHLGCRGLSRKVLGDQKLAPANLPPSGRASSVAERKSLNQLSKGESQL